jgi:pimeloyl-ACP methyl ester carboxylesterase
MAPFEAAAHAEGLATLSIDLPGMGASGVAGSRLRRFEALGAVCSSAVDWLQRRVSGPIATFGVSGGGLAALAASAFDARVGASVAVGCPYSLARILRVLPAQQRQHYLSWTGCASLSELRTLIDGFALAPALQRVSARCLIVHGTRDELVPALDAHELRTLIGPRAELRLLRGDDHMFTHALERGAAREWFGWLARSC